MKKIILFSIIVFANTAYSQVLETKDSCITGTPVEIFKHFSPRLRARWTDNEFLLITTQKEFEVYFRNADHRRRDSIAADINFNNNSVIVFGVSTAGSKPSTAEAQYHKEHLLQIKITQHGKAAVSWHMYECVILPKKIAVPQIIKLCNIYDNID